MIHINQNKREPKIATLTKTTTAKTKPCKTAGLPFFLLAVKRSRIHTVYSHMLCCWRNLLEYTDDGSLNKYMTTETSERVLLKI